MAEFTRRDFLRYALAGIGALLAARFVSTCAAPQVVPAAVPAPAIPEKDEPGAPAARYPDIAVVRGGEPEALARKAIEASGGMKRFVKKSSSDLSKLEIKEVTLGS